MTSKRVKITVISDTHNQHKSIPTKYLAGGDCIIHAGDVSGRGTHSEIEDFLSWFNELPYTYKILIAGNHDFFFERASKIIIESTLSKYPNIIYLNDSGIELEGIKFWGSPVQPWFYNWAFNRRGTEICEHWDMIPLDTDVLIVHGGPKNIGSLNITYRTKEDVGCPYLYEKISELKNLKLLVSGHIHEGYGFIEENGKLFVNASQLNLQYELVNKPYIIDTETFTIIES
jgi:predicted phosphodiesterase